MTPVRVPRLWIGCSGWNYASWRGGFYPRGLPASAWLAYYAARFDTVELNNTFYRLPDATTFAAWRRQTPAGFLIAVKASRYLTHMKRLREPEEPLERLFVRASALGPRLGPVLYQLPPNMHRDLDRLSRFIAALPIREGRRRLQHVVEFRHPSWYVGETFAMLEKAGVSLCLHDKRGSSIVEPFLGPLVYVRFHGTSGHYRGSYSRQRLERWAHELAEQWRNGRTVFAYFNNDPEAVAVANASTLRRALERLVR